jgi:hypothetical protein
MPPEGPVGTEDEDGPVGIEGEAVGGRMTGSIGLAGAGAGLDEKSLAGRLGAAPQPVTSGRVWRS